VSATPIQSVVVHAHCYQPPREDPWLEVVEAEPSAAPDHDWNARIDRECYARLARVEIRQRDARAVARDPDARAGLSRIVNLYGWCSFDVGATLCEWLETEAPETLAAMIAGDAASVRRWGHGNAIAAPYHHVILPLASQRDRITEVRWGIADFRRRFGRDPEGMWLPECAVDEDTLDVLAEAGIKFTILAPYQVRAGEDTHGMPVRWRGAKGREIAIVPYDGNLAGEVAFGGLLQNAVALAGRLAPASPGANEHARCTTLATDGETFGHHHRNGEVTLANALTRIMQRDLHPGTRLTNAAALVAAHPPQLDVTLVSPSAWSCAHGVERWRSNCGCRLDGSKPPAQQWRGPLRTALTALADRCNAVYETEGRGIFTDDPWAVRDRYGEIVAKDGAPLVEFVKAAIRDDLEPGKQRRAHDLLELQRATLRMFTSCAWFFDEVERIETRQVLRYAARALELSGVSSRVMPDFLHWLEPARGSTPGSGSASDLFVREAMPSRNPSWRAAAAAAACASAGLPHTRVALYDAAVLKDDTGPEECWLVTVTHRRTLQATRLGAIVHGVGPSLAVTVWEAQRAAGGERTIPVYEFPEATARLLLGATALDDVALLSVP
jgi:alpha-amylase/alpha-mannosidase (GH57 family)